MDAKFIREYCFTLADVSISPPPLSACAYQKMAKRPSSIDPPPPFDLLSPNHHRPHPSLQISRRQQQVSDCSLRKQCRSSSATDLYPLSVVYSYVTVTRLCPCLGAEVAPTVRSFQRSQDLRHPTLPVRRPPWRDYHSDSTHHCY